MSTLPDICRRKHGGNTNSEAANRRHSINRAAVESAIMQAGPRGLTIGELAVRMGVSDNAISGRFSELKRDGRVKVVGRRRNQNGNTAGVHVHVDHLPKTLPKKGGRP